MMIDSAYIEITSQCNLSCVACYNRSEINKDLIEISSSKIKKIMNILEKFGCRRFILAGGEPLCNCYLNEILDLIKNNPQYDFSISTNGTILNRNVIDAYNNLDHFNIQVSIDGSCEEVNSYMRGENNFYRTLEFIKMLKHNKKRVRLKMVISRLNSHDIENFYRFAYSLNAIPEFSFIYKQGRALDMWSILNVSEEEKIDMLRTVKMLNDEYSLNAYLPTCISDCPFADGSDHLFVAVKCAGDIMPCQLLYDDCFALGNIFRFEEESFLRNVEKITELAKNRKKADFNCVRCIVRSSCGKGCMAEAYLKTGNAMGFDDACNLRKRQMLQIERFDNI